MLMHLSCMDLAIQAAFNQREHAVHQQRFQPPDGRRVNIASH